MTETRVIVEMRNVSKRFGPVTAVDDITLDVPEGSVFGFIGPSGCGKTTTVRLMIGNFHPTEGTVKVFDRAPNTFRRTEQKRIGYMPQLFILYPEISVWENLQFAASIYGVPFQRKQRFAELLDLVELTGHENKLVREISGGMQRRLSLATTLIHNPQLIFLDEPTAGIDPVLRRKFWDYFRKLRDDGRTLFVTTQYVGEAAYCDYVGVLRQGRLLLVETPEGLRYKGLGGELVRLETEGPLSSSDIEGLRALPFVREDITFLESRSVQLLVDDAGKAIPQILNWATAEELEVTSISEFVPPFDDVFVKIMQDIESETFSPEDAVAQNPQSIQEIHT